MSDTVRPVAACAEPPPLPPWLWLWIALFAGVTLPWALPYIANEVLSSTDMIKNLQQQVDAMTASCRLEAASAGLAADASCGGGRIKLLDLAAIGLPLMLDLMPYLVLTLGVILAAVPWLARRSIKAGFDPQPLADDYPSLVVQAIRTEIQAVHPALAPMSALPNAQVTASVYPLSYRRCAVLIGGGLARLWRRDPAVGRAVLAHELTHWRQGEGWMLHVGSPLTRLLHYVPMLVALGVALPLLLMLTNSIVDTVGFAAQMNARIDAGNAMLDARQAALATRFGTTVALPEVQHLPHVALASLASHFGTQIRDIYGPGLLLILSGWISIVLWLLATLVGAIWSAEFTSDRVAAQQSPVSYAAWMAGLRPAGGFWSRLGDVLLHPPQRLRTRAARHSRSAGMLFLLLMVFPASQVLAGVPMLVWRSLERFGDALVVPGKHVSAGDIAAWLPHAAEAYARSLLLPLSCCGAAILLWPILAPAISRAAGSSSESTEKRAPYIAAGVLTLTGVAVIAAA
jgi:hypothetical protein